MSCDPGRDCWCKELPRAAMPAKNTLIEQARQAGEHSSVPLQSTPQSTEGCLCRDCLVADLRAQGLLPLEPN
jgi:hypothetical protein